MASEKSTSDFGARLREARERRGLSLRVIADTTKISVRALEALERNDISRLPGGIFSRAFVRGYACEVGLDPEQTVAEFITRFPHDIVTQGHPRTRALVDELEADAQRRPWPWSRRLALVAVPAVAIALYMGMSGRRAAPIPEQPVSAATEQAAVPSATAPGVRISLRALRAATVRVASDGKEASVVSLDAGATQRFDAAHDLTIVPSDPSAVEWSADGFPPRPLTGPLTLNADTFNTHSSGQ
jgi:cytoskeletal protein RodZ